MKKITLLTALTLTLITTQVNAGVAGMISHKSNIMTISNTDMAIPIDGGNTQYVATFDSSKAVIFYNAECAVMGNGYLDVDILVDGQELTPTDGDGDAMCTGSGDNKRWVKATSTGLPSDPMAGLGAHTIQVRAKVVAGNGQVAGQGHLGDSALVIIE